MFTHKANFSRLSLFIHGQLRLTILLTLAFLATPLARSQAVKPLLDLKAIPATQGVTPTSTAVTATNAPGGMLVTIQPSGEGYPGIDITPSGGKLDLSKYTRVDATLTNPGDKKIRVNLRLDNAGDWKTNPWNAEIISIQPGETVTLTVTFGSSYGHPGFALNPAAITMIKFFAVKSEEAQSFRIDSLVATSGQSAAAPVASAVKPVAKPATPLLAIQPLIDVTADPVKQGVTTTSGDVTVASSKEGMLVTIQPSSAKYPGIDIAPANGKFDLSGYGRVEVRVFNPGTKAFRLNLRLDNDGDWQLNPWNAEIVALPPGKSTTITVYFGISYGKPGYALNPAALTHIKLLGGKSPDVLSFRIESVVATGHPGDAPPIDPASIRVNPVGGLLFGKGVAFDFGKQLSTTGGAKAILNADGTAIDAVFSSAGQKQSVLLKPAIGRWDLRNTIEVQLRLKNTGKSPVVPSAFVNSNGGPTETFGLATPMQPGEEKTLKVTYLTSKPWVALPSTSEKNALYHGRPGTGTNFTNDTVSAVGISVASSSGTANLQIESVTAAAPPATLPVWLGNRPPVEGDWTVTLNENFNGTTVDPKKWNIYGENYYDQRTHWSKDNLIVKNGVATLRYEKKTGYQNDDPTQNKTEYSAGFLDTYDKWTQAYGYFEARMKLPTAPGLWPGFWMMPERGPAAGSKFKRMDTHGNGMEIDIMEFLSRWGTNRYNIAMHWDGYKAEHRSTGTQNNYVQTDKDGYITSGVLWLPGLLVFYGNGRELVRFEDPRVPSAPADIMFTLPSGGWDNDPLDDKKLPSDFVIDYVRAWQIKDPTKPGALTPLPK